MTGNLSVSDRSSSVSDLHKLQAARESRAGAVRYDRRDTRRQTKRSAHLEWRTPEWREEDNSREVAMVGRLIQATKSAYQYPLIFKQLWHTPRVQAPDQEVVYRDLRLFTSLHIMERIRRLASALSEAVA